MQPLPQLIILLEINSDPIIQLVEDIEPICHFKYPYEYHLTLGWLTDKNPDILRKWGKQSVNYVKEQIGKLEENTFKIAITNAVRQSVSRGGGFYLQPSEKNAQYLVEVHKELSSYMQRNQVSSSELISNYHPHVSLTTPITQETINADHEALILKALNNKIACWQKDTPEKLILQPIAIRAILKYIDRHGSEQREIWEIKCSSDN